MESRGRNGIETEPKTEPETEPKTEPETESGKERNWHGAGKEHARRWNVTVIVCHGHIRSLDVSFKSERFTVMFLLIKG
jgi:hypothetical protein